MHDAGALGGARGRDPEAGRGERAEHGRAVPAHGRMRRDADRLVDHDDVVVVVHDREVRERAAARSSARGGAPTRPRASRPRASGRICPATTPSRLAPPASSTSTAKVREKPSRRARAASARSPASPSGTGSARRSVRELWLGVRSRPMPRMESTRKSTIPNTIAMSATLKIAGKAQICEEVDDVPDPESGLPEQSVRQVAERAAQHQAEYRRPGERSDPAGEPDDEHDHPDRDDRQDPGESGARTRTPLPSSSRSGAAATRPAPGRAARPRGA